MSESIQ